ncbi:carboxypeptidase-like regulatory domain-containing protein [Frigoribacterium sp. PvP032]|uniref:carboxypeptidase-like regulatory domain-containing protein n=1 Tax=Frigoribacterium sp. PvP032 TaxID=2806589 RepID=UPI001AE21681|nr:carboxypeptidase-like regulatory domain-containing protein [Frigoribacterium sp. PvP032]MBP1191959.1 hypothetical protein [Frigoribacterium sp. PvP032]
MFQPLAQRLRPASLRDDSGLGIIEVVIALLVFALITTGSILAVGLSLSMASDNRGREVAANLAAQEIDLARAANATLLDGATTSYPGINGTDFTVVREVNWVTSGGVDSQCLTGATGAGSLFYKRVNVTVTWSGMRSTTQPVRADTVLSPDGKIYDATTGTILVSVTDQTGAGVKGVTATVTPAADVTPNTAKALEAVSVPAPTDRNGCAFAIKVAPGTYTVTLSRADGEVWVSPDQNRAPSQQVTLGSGSSTNAKFDYARADQYQLTWASGSAIRASNQAVTFVSASTRSVVTAPADVQYLYPQSSGYQVFGGTYAKAGTAGGTCKSPNPVEWPTATDRRTGKARPAVAPDYTVDNVARDVSVNLVTVPVKVRTSDLFVRATAATTAQANGDPGCALGTTLTFRIPANSNTVSVALPPGTWSLSSSSNENANYSSANLVEALLGLLGGGNVVTVDPRSAP